ncbi:MAG: hypothetical protein ACI3W9_07010 [Eubacteriales bacterium]
MYTRDFDGGIRSDGMLNDYIRRSAEHAPPQPDRCPPDPPPDSCPHEPPPDCGGKGIIGGLRSMLRGIGIDDLILIGIGVLLLLDSDTDNDMLLIFILLALFL